VVSHAFVANWVGFAGYTPAAVFGPEPLTAGKVAELVALKPTLVFENSHMPGGTEISTPANATLVSLINFPGDDLELMPVVTTNAATITAAVGG
jgi:zinc transport system substrate-binding protein